MRRTLRAILLAATLAVSGCANGPGRSLLGEGFNDELAGWSKHVRPESTADQGTGWSQKSRDIENNLGYR